MRSWSVDLREKVVKAYASGHGTIREISNLFQVSTSSVTRWRALEREEGSVAPRPHGGGQPRKVDDTGENAIKGWLDKDNDLTIMELRERFSKRFGYSVGTGTMARALKRMGWTRKKKPSTLQRKTLKESRN